MLIQEGSRYLLESDQGRRVSRREGKQVIRSTSAPTHLSCPAPPTGTTKNTTFWCSSRPRHVPPRIAVRTDAALILLRTSADFLGGLRGKVSHRLGGGVLEGNRKQPRPVNTTTCSRVILDLRSPQLNAVSRLRISDRVSMNVLRYCSLLAVLPHISPRKSHDLVTFAFSTPMFAQLSLLCYCTERHPLLLRKLASSESSLNNASARERRTDAAFANIPGRAYLAPSLLQRIFNLSIRCCHPNSDPIMLAV